MNEIKEGRKEEKERVRKKGGIGEENQASNALKMHTNCKSCFKHSAKMMIAVV